MDHCIDKVFDAAYAIANSLQKQFGKEKVIDKISFDMFAFDSRLIPLKWGKRINADGTTMSFNEIMECINTNSKDHMINIIITDGKFDVDINQVNKFLNEIGGCIIYVTNEDNITVKNIADSNKTKLFYILADEDFTVK
jgi:hypothetical protein